MTFEEELEWALNEPAVKEGRAEDDDLFQLGAKRQATKGKGNGAQKKKKVVRDFSHVRRIRFVFGS
jgi:hypothetical protein